MDGRGLRRATTRGSCPWARRRTSGRTATSRPASAKAALVLDETFSMANNQHHVLEPRSALAYWQNGKLYMHTGTQSAVQTVASIARWMDIEPTDVVLITEYTGGGFGSRATGSVQLHDSGAARQEDQRAGHDAHHARGRAVHRRHPPGRARPRQGRLRERRQAAGARSVPGGREQRLRGAGRRRRRRPLRLAALSARGHALARPSPC